MFKFKAGKFVEVILVLFCLYFSFGLLFSIYLDFEIASKGKIQQAKVLQRWQVTAKSKQIIDKALVHFSYNDKDYKVSVDAPDQSSETISIVFAPTLPYYAEAGTTRPDAPTTKSAIIKSILGAVFGIFSFAALYRLFRGSK